jgi:hypothetical protein
VCNHKGQLVLSGQANTITRNEFTMTTNIQREYPMLIAPEGNPLPPNPPMSPGKKRIILCAVGAVVLLAIFGVVALVSTSNASHGQLAQDLTLLRQRNPELANAPDSAILNVTDTMCASLRSGLSVNTVVVSSFGNGIRPAAIGGLMYIAAHDICPEFASASDAWGND